MSVETKLAVIILAGGQSTRMGTDKGLVLFHDRPLVAHVIDTLRSAGIDELMIITQHGAYEQFGIPCFPDKITDKGPLSGICTGLTHSTKQKNLILGCDMPFLSTELIAALIENMGDEDVLLSRHQGKAEPLCSVYDKNCLNHFEHKLQNDQLKITQALLGLRIKDIQFDDEPWFRGVEFSNMNAPEDLLKSQH